MIGFIGSFFRYQIVCHPMYHEDGTLKKLGFQLLVPETKKNTEHQRYYDQEPLGTFELSLTNGTKFDSIFNPWTSQESDAKKFSIKSAPNWSFYLTKVTDQVTLYLHTIIIVKQHYWINRWNIRIAFGSVISISVRCFDSLSVIITNHISIKYESSH